MTENAQDTLRLNWIEAHHAEIEFEPAFNEFEIQWNYGENRKVMAHTSLRTAIDNAIAEETD